MPAAERTSRTETAKASMDDPQMLAVSGELEPEATFKIAGNFEPVGVGSRCSEPDMNVARGESVSQGSS